MKHTQDRAIMDETTLLMGENTRRGVSSSTLLIFLSLLGVLSVIAASAASMEKDQAEKSKFLALGGLVLGTIMAVAIPSVACAMNLQEPEGMSKPLRALAMFGFCCSLFAMSAGGKTYSDSTGGDFPSNSTSFLPTPSPSHR